MNRWSFLTSICLFASSVTGSFGAEFTRLQAYELLKKDGYKWKQTELVNLDAKAKTDQAHSAFYPHINFAVREFGGKINPIQFGLTNIALPDYYIAGAIGIQLAYDVIDFSAISRLDAARSNEKIGESTTLQFQNDLTYFMLLQYLNVQRLKRKLEAIDASIQRNTEILKVATAKVTAGLGISLDLMRAKGLLESDTLRKLDATLSYTKAKQELSVTLGQAKLEAELEPLTFRELPAPLTDLTDEQVLIAAGNRPDFKVAQSTIEATQYLKKMAENESLPSLQIFADAGVYGTHVFDAVSHSITGTAGIQISLPLYSGGLHSGRVQEESVKFMKAELQSKHLELESQSQIRQALNQIKETKSAIDVTSNHLEIAQQELDLAKKRYASGSASGLELANSQANIATVSDNNIEAIFSYEASKLNFFHATGEFDHYFEIEKGKTP